MFNFFYEKLSKYPSSKLRFIANSALIASSLSSVGKSFAGNNPSGGPRAVPNLSESLNIDQLDLIRTLMEKKMLESDLNMHEIMLLEDAFLKIDNKIKSIENFERKLGE